MGLRDGIDHGEGKYAVTEEQSFVFLIPELAPRGTASRESDVSLKGVLSRTAEVSISREQLESFWKEKVVALTETLADSQSDENAKGFRVDEISFSIGVGAKGGVFFVAEGSVEASMTVKLRRAD
jgi:hypothetical protein